MITKKSEMIITYQKVSKFVQRLNDRERFLFNDTASTMCGTKRFTKELKRFMVLLIERKLELILGYLCKNSSPMQVTSVSK